MASTIKIKNSSTASAVPTSSDLVQGELAVNVTDKRIYTENASGTVVELGTNPSVPVTFPDGSASAPSLTNDGDTNTGVFFPAADTVGVTTGGTERVRIDTSGNLLVNTTATTGASKLVVFQDLGGVGDAQTIRDTGSSYGAGAVYVKFQNNAGSAAGSIQHTASTTVNYATSSDERLKIDKGIATDTSVIDNVVIHDYEWKEDGRIDRGVFAQEAYEVKPFAVSVGSDETNKNGVLLNPWSVDYSKFVPDLIVHAQQLKKQVQEQQAIITQLQADVAALKGQ